MIALIILSLYGLAMLLIFCYNAMQLQLVYGYWKFKRKAKKRVHVEPKPILNDTLPIVTVQLPIYNEKYVVTRLIDAVVALDYPQDKLEIQVLDDSTDETVELIAERVMHWQNQGVWINHVRRPNREGFKAGALAYGLTCNQGELIAIFDADFLPPAHFLKSTIGAFAQADIGMVQTRWEHLNENYSLMTQLQAFGLNAHFTVEQMGRNVQGHLINFNGTAGVWRKQCIEEAGGWQSDTLTEDLDLSYRAQLKGWKFKYLEEVGTPAELPVAMNALKTQQFRWTKGAAECARKNLWRVLRAPDLSLSTKLHACFHLLNSSMFVLVVLVSMLSFPLLLIKDAFAQYAQVFMYFSFFLMGTVFLGIFYWVSTAVKGLGKPKRRSYFFTRFPLFLAMYTGLSLHNALAVIEGLLGKKTPFIRTPKFNITHQQDQTWKSNQYLKNNISVLTLLEGLCMIYFLVAMGVGIYLGDYGLLPFHLMLAFGFGYICFYSVWHSLTNPAQR
jgi:cellulose synthase/poly-beta-1,6-N-acetylglucosamine synthase-like glycosyltransferase